MLDHDLAVVYEHVTHDAAAGMELPTTLATGEDERDDSDRDECVPHDATLAARYWSWSKKRVSSC